MGSPMAQEVKPVLKNKSEILFEAYLLSQGHTDFAFEPELQGTSKRPDYQLSWSKQDILFEVKEFRAKADDFGSGFGFFDPYAPLREKINAARVKFKESEAVLAVVWFCTTATSLWFSWIGSTFTAPCLGTSDSRFRFMFLIALHRKTTRSTASSCRAARCTRNTKVLPSPRRTRRSAPSSYSVAYL